MRLPYPKRDVPTCQDLKRGWVHYRHLDFFPKQGQIFGLLPNLGQFLDLLTSPDQGQVRFLTTSLVLQTAVESEKTIKNYYQSFLQLNKYETAPNFIQLNQTLTSDCLLI